MKVVQAAGLLIICLQSKIDLARDRMIIDTTKQTKGPANKTGRNIEKDLLEIIV